MLTSQEKEAGCFVLTNTPPTISEVVVGEQQKSGSQIYNGNNLIVNRNGNLFLKSQTTGRLVPCIVSPKKKKKTTRNPLNIEIIDNKTQVVRIRKKKGQIVQNCDVYVGPRCFHSGWHLNESKWANPFDQIENLPKKESLEKYKDYVLSQPKLKNSLHELKGKKIGCFCERKERPCHADVLADLVNCLDKQKNE